MHLIRMNMMEQQLGILSNISHTNSKCKDHLQLMIFCHTICMQPQSVYLAKKHEANYNNAMLTFYATPPLYLIVQAEHNCLYELAKTLGLQE